MRTTRLNLTVSKDVAAEARSLADRRGIALSRLVERALVRLLDDLEKSQHAENQYRELRRA
jgi:post-segregation antitoxin (ccd killing protein)